MIVIKHTENHISIKGHANYDVIGKDLVCCAVSILLHTLVESIEQMTEDIIKYSVKDLSTGEIKHFVSKDLIDDEADYGFLSGNVDIEFGNLSEKSKTLLNSFFVGIRMIASEYPENVKLTEH